MAKQNPFNIREKVIVITGGGGVLGGNMGHHLAEQGAQVVLLDLRGELALAKAEEINAKGGKAIGLAANVLDKSSLEAALKSIIQVFGDVNVLINAAGGNMAGATIGPDQTIFDLSIDAFQKVSELNLNGTVLPSLVFGKHMSEQKTGVIINISSMTAQRAISRVVGYSAAKAAIDNYTKWLACELALKFGDGLRVNAIAPGFFIGDQNRRLLLEEDGSLTPRGATIIKQTPMGRFGDAAELNGTIHWLISEAAKFVTGIVIPIDGGFSAYSGI